jgi:hypothetical protein
VSLGDHDTVGGDRAVDHRSLADGEGEVHGRGLLRSSLAAGNQERTAAEHLATEIDAGARDW